MIEIEPSGSFLPMDAEGGIINPTATALILPIYFPIVEELVDVYLRHLGDRLIAVYLRGSVPRGEARPYISDVDVVGVVDRTAGAPFQRWGTPGWAEATAEGLIRKFPFVPNIDIAVADHDTNFPGENHSVKFVLSTQGLCLWGDDVTRFWPRFRVDASIAFQYKWLEADYAIWRSKWVQRPDSHEKRIFLQSFCKTVIRSGFELVMVQEGRYTMDLYPCYKTFCKYHPEQGLWMAAALRTFLNPVSMTDLRWMVGLIPFLVDLKDELAWPG